MRFAILTMLSLALVMGASAQYLGNTILEGEVKDILMGDKLYELTLLSVADDRELAVFKVNGEVSKALGEREKFVFSDGSTVFVANILPNEGAEAGGADLVEFYFLASGGVLAKSVTQDEPAEAYDSVIDFLEQWGVASDSDVSGPVSSAECVVDSDCADSDGCTGDGCASGRCVHIPQNGCNFDPTICVAYNTRMTVAQEPKYCAGDRSWKDQVPLGSPCSNNHECVSNLCFGGICKEVDENGHVTGPEAASVPLSPGTSTIPSTYEPSTPVVIEQPSTLLEPAPAPQRSTQGFFAWLFSRLFWWA